MHSARSTEKSRIDTVETQACRPALVPPRTSRVALSHSQLSVLQFASRLLHPHLPTCTVSPLPSMPSSVFNFPWSIPLQRPSSHSTFFFFFLNDPAPPKFSPLPHPAPLPI